MTIVVEDGTGLSNADSYLSIADADTYHANRGNTDWTSATTEQKEIALRKSTEYLDYTYQWSGLIYSTTQSLNWPRTSVIDCQGRDLDNSVPIGVKNATAELALKALSDDLLPDTTKDDYVVREKVDVIEVEYDRNNPSIQNNYTYVSRMLSCLYDSSANSSCVKVQRI